jgi:hypothetical protein
VTVRRQAEALQAHVAAVVGHGALLLAVLSTYTGRLLRDAGFSEALRDKCWSTYSLASTAPSALPPTAPPRNIGDGCGRLLALEKNGDE